MITDMITQRLDAMITPARQELRLAQERAFERIQEVLKKAEHEVALKSRLMTTTQRLNTAEEELIKAEEHLLSALSSIFKALYYIAPQASPSDLFQELKEIKGEVLKNTDLKALSKYAEENPALTKSKRFFLR